MPTVKYKCKESGKIKKRVFPYNAIGKAQAKTFADMMGGSRLTTKNQNLLVANIWFGLRVQHLHPGI